VQNGGLLWLLLLVVVAVVVMGRGWVGVGWGGLLPPCSCPCGSGCCMAPFGLLLLLPQ
jgi:hypothetical protein